MFPSAARCSSRWAFKPRHCVRTISTAPITPTARATLHEVTGRDGLQNEKQVLRLQDKLKLVELLAQSRPMSVEVASFVRPDLVPAMADSLDLCRALEDQGWAHDAKAAGVGVAGLVPNLRGFETFLKARGTAKILDTAVCLVSCTESHSMANVRRSIKDALASTLDVIHAAKSEGVKVYAYATLAFQCPFEGAVDPMQVTDIAQAYAEAGVDRLVLADTLGAASPEQVEALVTLVRGLDIVKEQPDGLVALHMHDAHGRARENIDRAIKFGVRRLIVARRKHEQSSFDAATGGCGGCNFVPDARGNVATETVLNVLEEAGFAHGVDRASIRQARQHLEHVLGRSLP